MPAPSAIAELRARTATVKILVFALEAETLHSCRVRIRNARRSSDVKFCTAAARVFISSPRLLYVSIIVLSTRPHAVPKFARPVSPFRLFCITSRDCLLSYERATLVPPHSATQTQVWSPEVVPVGLCLSVQTNLRWLIASQGRSLPRKVCTDPFPCAVSAPLASVL